MGQHRFCFWDIETDFGRLKGADFKIIKINYRLAQVFFVNFNFTFFYILNLIAQ